MEKEGDQEDEEEEMKETNIGTVEEERTSQPSPICDKVVSTSTVFFALPS